MTFMLLCPTLIYRSSANASRFVVIYCKTFLCGQLCKDVNSIAPRATLQNYAKIATKFPVGFAAMKLSKIPQINEELQRLVINISNKKEKNDVTMKTLKEETW